MWRNHARPLRASRLPGSSVSHEREIALLTVSGIGLRTHTGVGERMFRALADAGINVKRVNTSEIRMSVVVARQQGAAALAALKKVFGLKLFAWACAHVGSRNEHPP